MIADDPHPAYMKLCTEYEELREQQRTFPSQWQEIEKEKAVIRKQLQDFQHTHFGELSETVLRTHYQPERKMPEWIMVCIFIAVVVMIVALSLDYFDVLRRSS